MKLKERIIKNQNHQQKKKNIEKKDEQYQNSL